LLGGVGVVELELNKIGGTTVLQSKCENIFFIIKDGNEKRRKGLE
jgi:hypothetical protein